MKRSKFPPLLAVVISLEMMLSPVAANAQGVAETMLMGMNVVGQAMGLGNAGPNPQTGSNIAMINSQGQGQPIVDPQNPFNARNLSTIPGFLQYLGPRASQLNCMTLPSKPTKVKSEVCTMGFTGQPGMSLQPQVFEADAYAKAYESLADRYDSFLLEGSNSSGGGLNESGAGNGVTCMNNVMKMLDGYFQHRVNLLTTAMTAAEMAIADFKKKSEADLFKIEEDTADLEGEGAGPIYDKVKSRRPAYEFANAFNDPSCSLMFASNVYNESGDQSGLKGINKLLKQVYQSPVNGAKYSAQSYTQAHEAVVGDLQTMASKVAQQAKLNFSKISLGDGNLGGFLRDLKSTTSSSTGAHSMLTPDVFAEVQANFMTKNSNMNQTARSLADSMKGASAEFGSAIEAWKGNSDSAFNSAVNNLQNKLLNSCLDRQIQIAGSLDTILEQINDRNITSSEGKKYDRAIISKRIKAILQDSGMSIDQKIKEIEKQVPSRVTLEVSGSMNTYEKDASGKTSSKTMQARDINSPAKYFGALVNNCKVQFTSPTGQSEKSMKDNVEALRSLRDEYKALTESTSRGLAAAIEEKLIKCPGSTVGKSVGSCTGDVFNTNNGGSFCATAAKTCATNMQACTQKAQDLVTAKTNKRAKTMEDYNKNVKALKDKVVADVKKKILEAVGNSLILSQPPYNAGFTSPTDIAYDVPEGQRYLKEFEQAKLKLDDPDKLLALMKSNIEKVKKAVGDQQKQMMGRGGVLGEHLAQVKQNYQKAQSDLERMAQECTQKVAELKRYENEQIRKQQEEIAKKQQEDQEAGQELCNDFSLFQQNHKAGCNEDSANMARLVSKLDPKSRDEYYKMKSTCATINPDSENSYESSKEVFIAEAMTKCRKDKDAGTALSSSCTEMLDKCSTNQKGKDSDGNATVIGCGDDTKLSLATAILNRSLTASQVAGGDSDDSGDIGEQSIPYCASLNGGGRGFDQWSGFQSGLASDGSSGAIGR